MFLLPPLLDVILASVLETVADIMSVYLSINQTHCHDTLQRDCFVFTLSEILLYTCNIHKESSFSSCVFSFIKAKQRSPYALNASGDSIEDQDGDSRYYAKTRIKG